MPRRLDDTKHQLSRRPELPLGGHGEAVVAQRSGEASTAMAGPTRSGNDHYVQAASATMSNLAYRALARNLNLLNRPVRTRMLGGVGGE